MNNQTDKPCILVVDDVAENIDVLAGPLADEYEVKVALNGAEALEAAFSTPHPNLILLDIMMPDMDGYAVCRKLRENKDTRDIPVIFVTAKSDLGDEVKGFEAGGADYITKPIRTPIALARIKTQLQLCQQQEALRKSNNDLDRRLRELEALRQELESANQLLHRLSVRDGLTGLLNRRRFDEIYTAEWQRGIRNKQSLALLMIDIDHFKSYHDTYGHIAGDHVLERIAAALAKASQRSIDKVARYGGEEFVTILPDTGIEGAMQVAEKMRRAVINLSIDHSSSPTASKVSISIGAAAAVPDAAASQLELIEKAESALDEAKQKGRNCCIGYIEGGKPHGR